MLSSAYAVNDDGTIFAVDVLYKADGLWIRAKGKTRIVGATPDGWLHWRDFGPNTRKALVKQIWFGQSVLKSS